MLRPGLFIGLLSVPAVVGIYNWANSDPTQKPLITRLIEKYSANIEELERRNAIHTLAAERAAFDRHLFFSCKSDMNIELSCPEIFNVGGSVNVPAGHYADLTDVVGHYEKRAKRVEDDRVSRMKDGKVQSIYDHGF
ncbi:hypothetical protein KEM55_007866 [Ascosphaera atra]|nr:hypothetical protein KEM55_007866 [Ascosphaera atra]